MPPYYQLCDEDWDHFEKDGWIGIIGYDGTILRKPGYQPILIPHSDPEARTISENECSRQVSLLSINNEGKR